MQKNISEYDNPIFKDNASVMLLIDPVTGHILDANKAAVKYYGYTCDQITSMKIQEINILSEEEVRTEMQRACKMEKNHFHFRHKLANGKVRHVDVYSGKIEFNGKIVLCSIIHDITGRIEAQQKFAKNEAELKELFQIMHERVKELTVLHAISKILEQSQKPIADSMQEIANILPEAMQYPEICSVKISYKNNTFKTKNYHESKLNIEKDLYIHDKNQGKLVVAYHVEKTDYHDYYFMDEEISLVEIAAERISKVIERKLTEEQLEVSEKRFKLAIKGSNDAPWDVDLQTNEYFYSNAWWKQIGFKPREVPVDDHLWKRYIHEEDLALVNDTIDDAIGKKKRNFEIEFRILHKNGHYLSVLSRAFITYNEKNEAVRMTGTNMDLTNRNKSIIEKEEKFRKISSIASDYSYSYTIDKNGRTHVEWIFGAFEKITGYKPFKSVDLNDFMKLIHPEDLPKAKSRLDLLKDGKPVDSELRIFTKEGQSRWVMDKAYPEWSENKKRVVRVICSATDITKRKIAELRLIKREKDLEESNAMKDKLFSIIGHDLKSPINNIISLSTLAEKKQKEYTKEKLLKFNKMIKDSSQLTANLLDNLLIWSQSQSKKLKVSPEKLEIKQLANNCFTFLLQAAKQKNILLINNVNSGVILHADKEMIETVLRNLISNAIKYSNHEGTIEVNSTMLNGELKISVNDNGIGMDKTLAENLFKLGENTSIEGTAGEKGTGLGLLICKDFTEKNKGRISVESEPGKGSSFQLQFNLD